MISLEALALEKAESVVDEHRKAGTPIDIADIAQAIVKVASANNSKLLAAYKERGLQMSEMELALQSAVSGVNHAKREQFAVMAMAAILGREDWGTQVNDNGALVAGVAVKYADALIKALGRDNV